MLVLSRRPEQAIIIDGKIRVEVIEVKGDKVRIGITADRDIPVYRAELLVERPRTEKPK